MVNGEYVSEGLLVTPGDDGWEVWCGNDGENIINAHLIGLGTTRESAIENAIAQISRYGYTLSELAGRHP